MAEAYVRSTPYKFVGTFGSDGIRFDDSTYHYQSSESFSSTNTVNGYKNPRWKEQIKNGQQAATPFVGVKHSVESFTPFIISEEAIPKPGYTPNPASFQTKTNWGVRIPVQSSRDPSLLSEDVANNLALKQLVRKIRKKQTSFQGGVFIGELLQTVKLITSPVQSLRRGVTNYVEDLRRLKPRLRGATRRKATEAVRDTWLEYQLGWAPLISEVDAGVQTLAESKVLSDGTWEPTRAVGVDKRLYYTANSQIGTGYPLFQVTTNVYTNVVVRYISCIDVGTYSALSMRRIGLSPDGWLPTLWELIPYSFVIDYFTNVGDMISAATLAKSSIRWTLKTVRKEYVSEFHDWRPIATPETYYSKYVLTQVTPGKISRSKKHVNRYLYEGSLVPDLVFNTPVNGTQWLNIAALVHARKELKDFYR